MSALPAVLAFLALLTASGAALAQPGGPAPGTPRGPGASPERGTREGDLRGLEGAIAASAEARRALEQEVSDLKTDGTRLAAALVATGQTIQRTEERVRAVEARLDAMTGAETAIRRSFEARRGVLVEVLAALQRMGRRPPPAVLVRVEDVLAAVRTSMLLGAVVPDLRAETEALAGDLAELVRLRGLIGAERETLGRELEALTRDRQRVAALVEARQARLAEAERAIAGERERATGLARSARTLKDLIDRMERDDDAMRRSEAERLAARRPEEPDAGLVREPQDALRDPRIKGDQPDGVQARAMQERFAAAAFRDPARLSPKMPFEQVRGQVPRPVSGDVRRAFGAADGLGGTARGVSIATRPGAVVTSPADGWVAYAGPFRSFGRLLIINAGGGYYLLLAGMDHISVAVGQFVLAGEPVATMGDISSLSLTPGSVERTEPLLYIEFRKDGGSIDPGPWWAKSQSEKVRG